MIHEVAPGFWLHRDEDGEWLEVPIRGELLNDFPMFNKGTAFTSEEREALGLTGILPPRVTSMPDQIARVMDNYARKTDDLERYIHLIALLDRNETLFYRILLDHLEKLMPIVYTPTVGLACQKFGHIYRKSRGLYLTPEDVDRVPAVLANWPFEDVSVIVVTDGERVLGLGDLGAGGMGISIGKLNLYVAGAGIHPARTLPVCLDTGTDNERLIEDPLYLGLPRRRVRGPAYDALVDAFIDAAGKRFPRAMIQFEDFGKANALRLLDRHRHRACCFNDDIQGTGAVTLAAVLGALRITGAKLEEQRVVIAGAGGAGIGIARALRGASIWMVDAEGLLTPDYPGLSEHQRPFAREAPRLSFLETVERVRPTVLIGVTGRRGLFTREAITAMDGPRPIVLPLSNPTDSAECRPEDALLWTGGRAIVAAGSPFPGTPQCNNVYIFPGVGLGVLASGAARVTDEMFAAAANELASMAEGERLFPPLSEIRRVSARIAAAVAREAIRAGHAPGASDEVIASRIAAQVWEPRYVPYRPTRGAVTRESTLRRS